MSHNINRNGVGLGTAATKNVGQLSGQVPPMTASGELTLGSADVATGALKLWDAEGSPFDDIPFFAKIFSSQGAIQFIDSASGSVSWNFQSSQAYVVSFRGDYNNANREYILPDVNGTVSVITGGQVTFGNDTDGRGSILLYSAIDTGFAEITSNDESLLFQSSNGGAFKLKTSFTGAITTTISANDITASRVYDLPDASGTILLDSDFGRGAGDIPEIIDAGFGVEKLVIGTGGGGALLALDNASGGTTLGLISFSTTSVYFTPNTNGTTGDTINGFIAMAAPTAIASAGLDFSSAVDTVYTFPNASGTVALTSTEKTSNFTARNDDVYIITATCTVTDPSPVQAKGFECFVRNGTATIGGVAYSTAGTVVKRVYHSGAWASYKYLPD